MNGTKWFLSFVSVVGSLALIGGMNWFVAKLYRDDHPGRMGYLPDQSIPPIDLAAAQRGWPANLSDAAERNRLVTYLHDTKGTVPTPTAEMAGASQAEQPPDLGTLLDNAVMSEGQSKARACISCHDFTSGGPDRIGPNLWGVVGRDIASKPGFSYSSALTQIPGAWTYEMLFNYLASPARSVPGTKMTFAGMRRAEDRAAVIKYLATLGDNPLPLPKPQPHAEAVAAAEMPR